MMFRTATVQVNMDFADEADMVAKLRVGLALQPVATALFANSPFTEGKPNGYQSYRAEMWRDTDPDRTGLLPFAFDAGMGFERYVDYALDVPMYFVYRDERYIDVAGASFRDFLAGKLDGPAGRQADARRLGRSSHHVVSRCAAEALPRDARRGRRLVRRALGAAGAVDRSALRQPGARRRRGADPRLERGRAQGLRDAVPRLGLNTPFRGRTLERSAARSSISRKAV